jgi:hypothetical protein
VRVHVAQRLFVQQDQRSHFQSEKKLGAPGYNYKVQAIGAAARDLGTAIGSRLDGATLVPVPPSKAKTDPGYDDRMLQICRDEAGAGAAVGCA